MKKYFMLFAAAVAAVAIVSCGDEKNEGQKEVEETLEDAEKALVAYLPLDSANQAVSIGEGISFVER